MPPIALVHDDSLVGQEGSDSILGDFLPIEISGLHTMQAVDFLL